MSARARSTRSWILLAALATVSTWAWWKLAATKPLTTSQVHGAAMAWPIMAIAVAAAGRLQVRIRSRGRALLIGGDAAAVAVALVFVAPRWLPLALVVGWTCAQLLDRRAPYATMFNLSASMLGGAAADAALRAVLGPASTVGGRGAAAVAAAVIVMEVVTGAAVLCHMRTCGVPMGPTVRMMVRHSGISSPISSLVSLAAVTLVWVDRVDGLLAAAVGLLAGLAARRNGALQAHIDTLERLQGLASALSGAEGEDQVVTTVLVELRTVFGADVVELAMAASTEGDEVALRASIDPQGGLRTRSTPWRPLEALALGSGPVLAARGDRRRRADLAAARWREALVVPADAGLPAVLVVADRSDGPTFSRRDLDLLEAMSVQAAMAIRRSRLEGKVADAAEARHRDARIDRLTGLPNRVALDEHLDAAGGPIAVALVGLDCFRDVNDTLGHRVGDAVLRQAAANIDGQADRVGALTFRTGGDEFAVVVPGDGARDLAALAARLVTGAGTGISVEGLALDVRASVGVRLPEPGPIDGVVALRHADIALHQAKAGGGGATVFDGRADGHSTRNLALAADLRTALSSTGLELWYQPKLELAGGRVTGAEGLLRWRHPTYGLVPPDEFIPLAERSGLINEVTWWVIDAAIEQLETWAAAGIDLNLAVNISPRDLRDSTLPEALDARLLRAGVQPARLTLEVTEGCVMADPARAQRVLGDLSALGVQIAIDDFGTGWSSLARLRDLPIDEVKIDRSFVWKLSTSPGDAAIVRSVIDLARNMRRSVVAEGIEDADAMDMLAAMGCHHGQGYFIARPMPAAAFADWYEERTPQRAA